MANTPWVWFLKQIKKEENILLINYLIYFNLLLLTLTLTLKRITKSFIKIQRTEVKIEIRIQ